MYEDFKVGILLGLLFGVIIGSLVTISYSQSERMIIKHGCAQYNNITGNFEWIKKRVDDDSR
jgi:hypothetical protein